MNTKRHFDKTNMIKKKLSVFQKAAMKMMAENFKLKWNDYNVNLSDAFRDLREEKDFFDVTLACGNDQIQAHKVILSACSPLFRSILKRNPHQHPLLYLGGIRMSDLEAIVRLEYNRID